MKTKLIPVMGLIGLISSVSATAAPLSTDKDKLSYTIGADLGKNLKSQGIEINTQAFTNGLVDATSGKSLQMSDEQMKQTLRSFQQQLIAKKLAKYKKAAEENKKVGEAFLEKNKAKKGVKTTKSGLQYLILKPGTGKKPTKEDEVTVEYTGKLLNGTVFDSTEKTGKPATFKLTQVIPGWTEALQLMKEGATWEVYVPADLAYGARGVGGPIGPNETLIFKIHLIAVKASSAKKS